MGNRKNVTASTFSVRTGSRSGIEILVAPLPAGGEISRKNEQLPRKVIALWTVTQPLDTIRRAHDK